MAGVPIRTAVVGVGYLGRFHAQKYARRPEARLVAVVDTDREVARRVAAEAGCEPLTDLHDLIGRIEAASIVVPTVHHAVAARPLLEAGIHCLIEKPFAATLEEAESLADLARRCGVVLQVGHLERFNPIWTAATAILTNPLFIEAHRLAAFKPRALDVDVIMDLMIHDIDLALAAFRGRALAVVHAVGVPVLSPSIDIANARLVFEGGAVANLTASRVSVEAVRKFRVFQPDAYISMDFGAKRADVIRMEKGPGGVKSLSGSQLAGEESDALEEEIAAFLRAVAGREAVAVGPEEGLRAMQAARRILDGIRTNPGWEAVVRHIGP